MGCQFQRDTQGLTALGVPECMPLRCEVEADLGMPPLLEMGSPEEIAVKPPSPLCPRPSALLSGLSVTAFCPAAQTCSCQHNCI